MSKLKSLNQQFISNLKTHKLVTNAKRNLILSILKSTTTKREAKNYLNKYQSQFDFSKISYAPEQKEDELALSTRDSQRELFINRFLNDQNPFVNIYDDDKKLDKIKLRLAIFNIKFTSVEDSQWLGIAETLKRLIHLGISPVIILDYDHLSKDLFKHNEAYMIKQANKIMRLLGPLEEFAGLKLSALRSVFSSTKLSVKVDSLEQILIPMYQGIIPIIQPITYSTESGMQELLESNKVLWSLCSSLIENSDLLSIEKIVMVDPLGGIPSIERNQTSHVFINLSQEYSDIVSELYIGFIKPEHRDLHLQNLRLINGLLTLISEKSGTDDATGIITTPSIVSINNDQLNPIIYNVLTDRPIISSSLPSSHKRTPQLSTSILKKGIDVNVIDPDNFNGTFTFTNLVKSSLVDQNRLFDLINDSFGATLNTDAYLKRINNSVATIIIVGDYDGAAIITRENGVAYLDKFAIAKKNQGLPGLADIIFKIILQSHPTELIWRSRKNNPVNKWYFERCRGCMGLPDSRWKIFYTGEIFNKSIHLRKGKVPQASIDIREKMKQYIDITENIPPSFK